MESKDLAVARNAGSVAFSEGKNMKANPYSYSSEQYFAWLRGWGTARFGESLRFL